MKGCTVKAPTLPKVPAGPTKYPAHPAQAVRNLYHLQAVEMQISQWQRSLLFGQGFCFLREPTPWSGARNSVPQFTFMAQSYHRASHREPWEDPWDRVWRYRRKSLAQLRGGEGWAAAWYSPWQLPGISVSCSTAAHELSQRITGVPLSPQASPSHFGWSRGLSVTVSWGRGGWSVCVEEVLQQCQSPRWGSNLLDTLPALALVPQGNIELLARCLSPPSMPPLPAHRTPVALTREQWEFLLFSFPLRLHFYLNFSAFDFQSSFLVIQQD